MDIETALRLHYDAFAKEYERVDQGVERVLSRLKIPPESSILDIGCGTGNLTFRLPEKRSFRRVVGIDLSDGVIRIARKHARASNLRNFEFFCASACRLPFSDEEFDAVVSNMVFHLIPDQQKALAEVVRVLKPRGYVILQFMGGGDVAPEMMEILRNAWNEILPQNNPPNLLCKVLIDNKVTVERVAKYLTDLGMDRFEVVWRRNAMIIEEANLLEFLEFFRLVGSFWQWGISKEAAECIENLVTRQAKDKVRSTGYFSNTVNSLLIEFTKPQKS